MATSRSGLICQAIVSHLNATAYPIAFVAQRFNLAVARQETIKTAKVYVSPGGLAQIRSTRGSWRLAYDIELTVVQCVQIGTINEEDQLIALTESLPLLLDRQSFAGANMLEIEGEGTRTLFDSEELAAGFLFFSNTTVTLIEEDK